MRGAERSGLRTDIQALRALAVGLVVVNHLWPGRLGGGYVGVDVFFVVSGFLITTHLVAELGRSGRVRLGRFYARRARRLIPAATLVLLVSVGVAYLVLPYPLWERTAWEALSSALYVENWYLASQSVDYSALNDAATVAQHYWSLSVEEQFYLVWPGLLAVAWWLAVRRQSGRHRRPRTARAIVVVIALVSVLSFVAGHLAVLSGSPAAYFVTWGRVWEFGVGALVAVLGPRLVTSRGWSTFASAGGIAAIVGAAVAYDHTTPFPGSWALVPVLGTAGVLWSGIHHERQWHDRMTRWSPVQWAGDASYSIYLWHWPLIVLAPFVLGRPRGLLMSVGLLLLTIVLAEVTRRVVEQPLRVRPAWVASPARSLRAAAGMMAVTMMASVGLLATHAAEQRAHEPPLLATVTKCGGPNALAHPDECVDPFGPVSAQTAADMTEYFYGPEECIPVDRHRQGELLTTMTCDFSDGAEDPTEVWLVGDSHAQHWQGLVFDMARERGWTVVTSYLGGCPIVDVPYVGLRQPAPAGERERCSAWSADVRTSIVQDRPDIVLTSSAARLELIDDGTGRNQTQQMADAFERVWRTWGDAGVRVVPLMDPPLNGDVRDPLCATFERADPERCAVPRAEAHPPDPQALAADRVDGVEALDLSSYFCDTDRCYAVVGGMSVYYDADHLSLAFVRQFRHIVDDWLVERFCGPGQGGDVCDS